MRRETKLCNGERVLEGDDEVVDRLLVERSRIDNGGGDGM